MPDHKDRFVECDFGGSHHKHWGQRGAAGLLLACDDHWLLQQRGKAHQGGTWAVPGGALKYREIPFAAAIRETSEETSLTLTDTPFEYLGQYVYDHGVWRYTTFVIRLPKLLDVRPTNDESIALKWIATKELQQYPLLPSFAESLPQLFTLQKGVVSD